MTVLGRDALTGGLKYEDVPAPEYANGTGEVPVIRVRALNLKERFAIRRASRGPDGEADPEAYTVALLACSLVDEQLNRLYGDDDTEAVAELPGGLADRLSRVALRLSGWDVEDAAKNSESGQTSSPSTPSPNS